MTIIVISSMLSSYLFHAYTANFYKSCTAEWGSFLTNAGATIFNTSSFDINYHNPSEAITANLFSNIYI